MAALFEGLDVGRSMFPAVRQPAAAPGDSRGNSAQAVSWETLNEMVNHGASRNYPLVFVVDAL
jgi:hypothetical protein